MPHKRVRFCRWLGLLLWAILGERGRPNRPCGGWEMGPKLIKNGLFCSFFYSLRRDKFCNGPWRRQIWLVTRHVTLGHFWGAWEAKLAMWGLRNGAKIDQKWAFSLFFYSTLKGKSCNAPQTSQTLPVTRPVTLGHFEGSLGSQTGHVGARKWGENWSKMGFLDASMNLYKSFVRPLVSPLVRPSVIPSVTLTLFLPRTKGIEQKRAT